MAKPLEGKKPMDSCLADKSVEDLLLLVGDQDLGFRVEAMNQALSIGFPEIYPVLERAVRNDGNADLRNGAMEVLVRFGRQAVPALIALLRDADEEVRNFSAVMLGDIASREALYPLIEALRDPDINVSHAAAEALGKIGDDAALLPLIQLLEGDFWLQYPAVVAMGEMADSRAVPHLIPLLDHELLMEPVLKALGQIGDARALPHLLKVLCDDPAKHIAAAAGAIVAVVEKGDAVAKDHLVSSITRRGIENLLRHISSGDGDGKVAAVALLGLVGDKAAIPTLLRLLEEHDYEEVVKKAITGMAFAATTLEEGLLRNSQKVQAVVLCLLRNLNGKVSVDHLLSLFHQGSPEVQLEVLASLAGTTEPEVFKLVESMLENGSTANSMTDMAAKVISRFSPDRISPLCNHLFQSADLQQRRVAALVAGYAEADIFTDHLSGLFGDREVLVRLEAVKAAGKWKKKEFLPLLVSALSDEEELVRREALFSLTEYGEAMPVNRVLQQLGRQDERLDYEIIMAIGRIGRTEAEMTLVDYLADGGISTRLEFAVIEALGKIGSRKGGGWQTLSRYLGHADPDIRRLAVQALASIGAGEFVEEIAEATQDRHWSVRAAALQGLGRSGSDCAIPCIAAALKDPDVMVKKNAVSALAETGNGLAVPELAKCLADPELVKYASEALYELGSAHLSLLHALAGGNEPLLLRQGVLSVIGKFDDEQSVRVLADLVKNDPVEEIRTAASHALILRGGRV
ncbi:HEAT repeat domain-containing protein [Geotalea toluenoxydans]